MIPAPHQWSSKLGSSGDAHQDDSDDGHHDVDALPQQDSGVVALELDRLLLLLLLELQLGHASLTRLQGFLRKTGRVFLWVRPYLNLLKGISLTFKHSITQIPLKEFFCISRERPLGQMTMAMC